MTCQRHIMYFDVISLTMSMNVFLQIFIIGNYCELCMFKYIIRYRYRCGDTISYNTRNKHTSKLRAAYGKHNFMYSNFRFVGIKIWNYITEHLDINITLPKFKKILKINDIKLPLC